MAQAIAILSNEVRANIAAQAVVEATHSTAQYGKYDGIAKAYCNGTKKADAGLVAQGQLVFVLAYVKAQGYVAEINDKGQCVLSATATAGMADPKLSDFKAAFGESKNTARNGHTKGIQAALKRQGLEVWDKAAKGPAAAVAPTVDPAAGDTDVTGIPPSIIAGIEQVRDAVLHFQTTQKLTKDAKEAIGKLAEMTQALLDKANGK